MQYVCEAGKQGIDVFTIDFILSFSQIYAHTHAHSHFKLYKFIYSLYAQAKRLYFVEQWLRSDPKDFVYCMRTHTIHRAVYI